MKNDVSMECTVPTMPAGAPKQITQIEVVCPAGIECSIADLTEAKYRSSSPLSPASATVLPAALEPLGTCKPTRKLDSKPTHPQNQSIRDSGKKANQILCDVTDPIKGSNTDFLTKFSLCSPLHFPTGKPWPHCQIPIHP